MRLTWHMYHLSTFTFKKNEDVDGRAAESASKYPPKNTMKRTKSSLWYLKQFRKCYRDPNFFTVLVDHVTLVLTEESRERGCLTLMKDLLSGMLTDKCWKVTSWVTNRRPPYFADHLIYLLMIFCSFCSFSFILFLLNINV